MRLSDDKIREILREGKGPFCDHKDGQSLYSHALCPGLVVGCGRCFLHKTGDDFFAIKGEVLADYHYNQQRYEELKKEMTDDYKAGFKAALDAIEKRIIEHGTSGGIPSYIGRLRKEVLTKKVTKWVNVRTNPSDPAGFVYGTSYGLYDTKDEAAFNGKSIPSYVGTYPVEIEVEL